MQADWEDVMACSAFYMIQTGGVGVSENIRYSVREMKGAVQASDAWERCGR